MCLLLSLRGEGGREREGERGDGKRGRGDRGRKGNESNHTTSLLYTLYPQRAVQSCDIVSQYVLTRVYTNQ